MILFDPPPRVMKIKTKINIWDLIKLKSMYTRTHTKSMCTAKEIKARLKDNPQNGKK